MATFSKRSSLPVSQQALYDWHASGSAFSRLAPPWEQIEVEQWCGGEATTQLPKEEQYGDISTGAQVFLRTKVGPLWQKMHAVHIDHKKPSLFVDEMKKGPFAHWVHEHRFLEDSPSSSILEDVISYRLPLSPLSDWIVGRWVHNKPEKMFEFRHRRTMQDLEQQMKYDQTKKKIAITGASGLVGSELCGFLQAMGHEVYKVSRHKEDSARNILSLDNPASWEGLNAVVHLAGEPIAGRWTEAKKHKIQASRVQYTSRVASIISRLSNPPEVLVSASAIGWYGDRGDDILTEESTAGKGFLADVCRQWEEAVAPAKEKGIRCVHPRIGMVVTPKGGALEKMLLPFKLGMGGPIGRGTQWMSWISLDDLIHMLYFLIQTPQAHGAFNATAPHPVRNKEFGNILGKALHRPSFMPLPSWAVVVGLGEMGEALLLEGAQVLPKKSQEMGFEFLHPTLAECLKAIL